MAVVSLKIAGRFYKFSCADGQEAYMATLADNLDKKAEQLLKSIGFMQEGQLLAMLCLLQAEEKNQLEKTTNIDSLSENQKQITESLTNLATRISVLADDLAGATVEKNG